MKPHRLIYDQPAEVRLFMPLLAVLGTGMSCLALHMLMFVLVTRNWEREIPLRLFPAGSSARLPDHARSPEIMIREDHQVEFDGRPCDSPEGHRMPELQARIRAHLAKLDAATIVVLVEPEARYERLVDVLNALGACRCTRYRVVILPRLVGPKPRKHP